MIEASFTHGELEPIPPTWESLFPLPATAITDVRDRLLCVTDADICSFIDVRKEGRSNDVTTALLKTGFAKWHIEHGDFSGNRSVLMYSAGKLYGAQMALGHYKHITGKELRADDPDAYDIAKYSVFESYRGIEADSQWERDYKREQSVTGGKTLAILNAALHDHTLRQFEAMYGDEIPENEALESFYTGLLDASIFIEAYARFRDNTDLLPVLRSSVEKPVQKPAIVDEIYRDMLDVAMLQVEVQLESDDNSLDQVLAYADPKLDETETLLTRQHGKLYAFDVAPVLTQCGPNSFRCDKRVLAVSEAHMPRLQRVLRAIGYGAIGGASSFVLPELVGQRASPFTTALSIAIASVGIGAIGWKTQPVRIPSKITCEPVWSEDGYTPHHEGIGRTSLQTLPQQVRL